MKKFFLTLVVLALFVAAFSAPAMAKPNFTGEWKIDADKSNFGPMPPPDKFIRTIKHSDPDLEMTTDQAGAQGEDKNTAKYKTDGTDVVNQLRGTDVKGKASWDGDKLKISNTLDFGGTEVKLDEIWTLSADGKVLTTLYKINSPQGEFELTFVLNKQ
ncbi:MAG: hypothetical protein K2X35_23435 [Bryobacteraceae bacterium]|nr:hypothetical protein [Bryobacteraceae bacterium]